MSEHPINEMLGTTLEKIKEMTNANTVIGEAVTAADGTIIIPVSKVSYGFTSGGTDFASKSQPQKDLFGGGAGAGISVTPVAFITISNGETKLLQIDPFHSSLDRVIDLAPELIEKISKLIPKKNDVVKEDSKLVSESPVGEE